VQSSDEVKKLIGIVESNNPHPMLFLPPMADKAMELRCALLDERTFISPRPNVAQTRTQNGTTNNQLILAAKSIANRTISTTEIAHPSRSNHC